MMLSRSRELRVNMGGYEHLTLSAMVVVHDVDLLTEEEIQALTPAQVMAKLVEFCEQYLTSTLKPEVKAAAAMSSAKDSMIFQPETHTPAPAPTRRVRSTRRT